MTQKNAPGYPLPAGELGADDIACQLVYLPDRDEYWRALYGALSYMATWRAWERDTDKRGKDAASDWRIALELTTECWRMACLEDIQDTIDEILRQLETKKDCCDENITYIPIEPPTTEIDPGVGDPPDNYGETAVEDWDEWMEYLCAAAHKYVDGLAEAGEIMKDWSKLGAIGIGIAGAVMALLVSGGVLIPFSYQVVAGIVAGLSVLGVHQLFDDTEDDIEAARDSIVCAILTNDDLPQAVENALSSGSDWDLFYQFMPFDTAIAVMYEGGYEGEWLDPVKKADCFDCDLTQLFDGDVWFSNLYGDEPVWQEELDAWSMDSTLELGCEESGLYLWANAAKTIRLQCHVHVISCSQSDTCGGGVHHAGNVVASGPPANWTMNHPTLPTPDLSAVDYFSSKHDTRHAQVFKLYTSS